MRKHLRWLYGEVARWVADGLISREQADALLARYPPLQPARPWATIIFSGLGAVIVGLGVILLFAYNWQAMPKGLKLAIIFAALAGAHGGGMCLVMRERYRSLGEALCVLGTMLFGAGIWLVAQIYHIEEHFPNGLLLWALGALAMAWALPSVAQGIIAAALFTIWCGVEAVGFDTPTHLAPVIILVLVGGLAWRMRSRTLLASALLSFAASVLLSLGALHARLVVGALLALGALYVAAADLAKRHGRFAESSPVFNSLGWVGYLIGLYLLTFSSVIGEIKREWPETVPPMAWGYWWALLAVCAGAWGLVAAQSLRQIRSRRPAGHPLDLLLVPLSVVFYSVLVLAVWWPGRWTAAGPFNLVFLAHAAALMARGCRRGELRLTLLGSLLLTVLTAARYFDMFHSLIARGLVFVLVGALLFAEGIVYTRSRKPQATPEGT